MYAAHRVTVRPHGLDLGHLYPCPSLLMTRIQAVSRERPASKLRIRIRRRVGCRIPFHLIATVSLLRSLRPGSFSENLRPHAGCLRTLWIQEVSVMPPRSRLNRPGPTSPYDCRFCVHPNISFTLFKRFLIRSMSCAGVLMPCVDFF